MKYIVLIGILSCLYACVHKKPVTDTTRQQRAEELAKPYLDSALKGNGAYQIAGYGKVDTLFADGDTSRQHKKTDMKGWAMNVTYQGNDALGIFEMHKVQLRIDTGFSRIISMKEYLPKK
ncbi:MAG: hypothetical protein ACTHJ8_12905 [Mucilaginibacter sp.]